MLNALVDRQDRNVPGSSQATVAKQPSQVVHHTLIAISGTDNTFKVIRSRQL